MTMKKRARSALALLLAVVLCIGMMPSAFAGQQNSYHDPYLRNNAPGHSMPAPDPPS